MKYLSLIILLSFSVHAFANEKLCEFMEKNQLKSMVKRTADLENEDYMTLVNKVSVDVESNRAQKCSSGDTLFLIDTDKCSSKCFEKNETQAAVEAVITGRGDFKPETRKCQELCQTYSQIAFAFKKGLAAAGDSSPDCHEAISHSERENNKSDLIDVVNRLPSNSGSGSRQ